MTSAGATGDAKPARLAAILCTCNRADMLRRALEGLAGQTLPRSEYEVVVVDDGSTDDTRHVAAGFDDRLRLRYVYQRNAGLASAKNHGLFSTMSPIVLFLDDDDVADPNLLEEHLKSHRRYAEDHYAVLGYTRLDPTLARDPLMRFITEVEGFLFSYSALKDGSVVDYSYFWGGRSSCKRPFLLKHGVFNPIFKFGCEDIELGFRLSRQKFRVVYNAHAASTMVRRIDLDGFCARLIRQGRSNVLFSRLHQDGEVQRWTEVAQAEAVWPGIAPVYDALVQSARHLDRLATRKEESGFPLEEADTRWLHHGYRTACRAAKMRGIIEGLEGRTT